MLFDRAKIWCSVKAGIFLTILSSLAHATGNLFSKYVANQVSVMNIVAIRYIFQCIMSTPSMVKEVKELGKITKLEWTLIFVSGIFQMVSSGCAFLALAILPIMDATTLIKIQPIFVNFLSWLWLKELITWLDFAMTGILMGGVILVCEPAFIFNPEVISPDDSNQWMGQVLAICAALSAALATCMVRRIRNVGTSIILFWQGFIIVFISLFFEFSVGRMIEPSTILGFALLLGAALGEAFYRASLTAALMVEESAIVASFQTVEILFSLVYEIIFFHEIPNELDLAGALLIIAGVIILACKIKIIYATRCKCCQNGSLETSIEESLDERSRILTK